MSRKGKLYFKQCFQIMSSDFVSAVCLIKFWKSFSFFLHFLFLSFTNTQNIIWFSVDSSGNIALLISRLYFLETQSKRVVSDTSVQMLLYKTSEQDSCPVSSWNDFKNSTNQYMEWRDLCLLKNFTIIPPKYVRIIYNVLWWHF